MHTLYLTILQAFKLTPFLTIILTVFAIISLFFMCIVMILDVSDRPGIKQYPYNFILDRIIPIIAIISPTIIVLQLTPDNVLWIDKFSYILIIHIFILLPLIYYWSNHRNWNAKRYPLSETRSWSDPKFYLDFAIAIIYPLVIGLYFSCIRYIRITSENNWENFSTEDVIPLITVCFFLWPYTLMWFRLLLWFIITLRVYLWDSLYNLLYSIHLFLLRFKWYFFIMYKYYKLSFIISSFVCLDRDIYRSNISFYQRMVNRIYSYPIIIGILIASIFLVEFFFFKFNLIYIILFIYPILRAICYALIHFSWTFWVEDCCKSDLFRGNFKSPKYPYAFYLALSTNHELLDTLSLENRTRLIQFCKIFLKNNNKYRGYNHLYKLTNRVSQRNYCFRMRTAYFFGTQVRWMHTERVLLTNSGIWHKATAMFASTIWDQIALLNNSFKFYPTLLAREKDEVGRSIIFPKTSIYSITEIQETPHTLQEFVEQNTPTVFSVLKEHNVVVSNYKEAKTKAEILAQLKSDGSFLDTHRQKKDDVIIDFRNNRSFEDKRIHGYDMKAKQHFGDGKSTIMAGVPPEVYDTTIQYFRRSLKQLQLLSQDMNKALQDLVNSSNNLDQHILCWAKNLHHFGQIMPPLKVPNNFALHDIKPEILKEIEQAGYKMTMVSERLDLIKAHPLVKDRLTEEDRTILTKDEKLREWMAKGWIQNIEGIINPKTPL